MKKHLTRKTIIPLLCLIYASLIIPVQIIKNNEVYINMRKPSIATYYDSELSS